MKKISYILVLLLLQSCIKVSIDDCLQSSGNTVTREVELEMFTKILVHEGIALTIAQADTQKVEVTTGSNLVDDVSFKVVDSQLIIEDPNNCDWTRNYAAVKVKIYTPNLTEIRSSTQYDINSEGQLAFPTLQLLSEDYYDNSLNNSGDFKLNLTCNSLRTVTNGFSNFIVSGQVQMLNIFVASGSSRFEGGNLIANEIVLYHRGSNDLILYPIDKISGNLYSTGNVILKNKPPIIDVTGHYKGKLIID
jgi:hypothetical protein